MAAIVKLARYTQVDLKARASSTQRAQLLTLQALNQHCDLAAVGGAGAGASSSAVDALDPTRTGSPRGLSTNVFRSGLASLPPPLGRDSFRAVDLGQLRHMVLGLRDAMDAAHARAAVVLQRGAEVSADDIHAALREMLSAYKVPKHYLFFESDDLPFTDSGKIQKNRLAEMIALRIRKEG